jgi:ABC-type multidrug transport system ATPase subunit
MKIEVTGLRKEYGNKTALGATDMVIDSPCLIGLVGPNGAGKLRL